MVIGYWLSVINKGGSNRRAHPPIEVRSSVKKGTSQMHLRNKIKETAATGYILLWLIGIPIPILLVIFLLRGCT